MYRVERGYTPCATYFGFMWGDGKLKFYKLICSLGIKKNAGLYIYKYLFFLVEEGRLNYPPPPWVGLGPAAVNDTESLTCTERGQCTQLFYLSIIYSIYLHSIKANTISMRSSLFHLSVYTLYDTESLTCTDRGQCTQLYNPSIIYFILVYLDSIISNT